MLAGHPAYEVTKGEVLYEGKNLLEMAPDERAREGVFMAFQYPIEVPGVSNAQFLRLAYNEKRKHLGEEELDPLEFKDLLKERAKVVEMDASFMTRSVNEGFSGGEKKRNEILQMAVLEPKLAVLDETDSGLDIDALRIVAGGVNQLHNPENAVILVTHYQRLLELHRAALCARAGQRPHRERRRQGVGAGTRTEGLRLAEDSCAGNERRWARRRIKKMVTEIVSRENSYQQAFRALQESRAATRRLSWLERLRENAMERFEELGFPSVKDEEWKYTNVAPIASD